MTNTLYMADGFAVLVETNAAPEGGLGVTDSEAAQIRAALAEGRVVSLSGGGFEISALEPEPVPTKAPITDVQFHGVLDDTPGLRETLNTLIAAISDDVTRRRIRGKLRADRFFSYDDPDMQLMKAAMEAHDQSFDLALLWDAALEIT